jgi:hypothetical protein
VARGLLKLAAGGWGLSAAFSDLPALSQAACDWGNVSQAHYLAGGLGFDVTGR